MNTLTYQGPHTPFAVRGTRLNAALAVSHDAFYGAKVDIGASAFDRLSRALSEQRAAWLETLLGGGRDAVTYFLNLIPLTVVVVTPETLTRTEDDALRQTVFRAEEVVYLAAVRECPNCQRRRLSFPVMDVADLADYLSGCDSLLWQGCECNGNTPERLSRKDWGE